MTWGRPSQRACRRTATARARIEEENARIAVEALRQEVGLELRRAYLDYRAAREQLAAAAVQVRAAELALRASEERYQVGAGTLVELTQAHAVHVQAASARHGLLRPALPADVIEYYSGGLDAARGLVG